MVRNFAIVTDSSCDLTDELAKRLELEVLPLKAILDGVEYANYLDEREIKLSDYYAQLRAGKPAHTSQANVEEFETIYTDLCEKGKDILYLGFSSGLSGTFNAGRLAAESIKEKYPDRKIYVVDTLCASMGQGLIVYLACMEAEKGKSIEEVRDFVEDTKPHLCHWFTVDDLNHLKRGGRVSTVAAALGTVLNVKPVLHVDNEGHLIPMSKVRGRKQSLVALLDKMEELGIDVENQVVGLSHGDCLDEAVAFVDKIKERFNVKDVILSPIGPVIGTHSGPGTMALFFIGKER